MERKLEGRIKRARLSTPGSSIRVLFNTFNTLLLAADARSVPLLPLLNKENLSMCQSRTKSFASSEEIRITMDMCFDEL